MRRLGQKQRLKRYLMSEPKLLAREISADPCVFFLDPALSLITLFAHISCLVPISPTVQYLDRTELCSNASQDRSQQRTPPLVLLGHSDPRRAPAVQLDADHADGQDRLLLGRLPRRGPEGHSRQLSGAGGGHRQAPPAGLGGGSELRRGSRCAEAMPKPMRRSDGSRSDADASNASGAGNVGQAPLAGRGARQGPRPSLVRGPRGGRSSASDRFPPRH